MNEYLISGYKPDVRNEFEQQLRVKLKRIEHRQKQQRNVFTVITVFVVLAGSAWFIPPIRAQLEWWVKEIAGITFVEVENPRENWEAIHEALTTPTPEPTLIDGEYLWEDIRPYAPFAFDAPAWVPDGYQQSPYITITHPNGNLQAGVTWHKVDDVSEKLFIAFEAREIMNSNATNEWEPIDYEASTVEEWPIYQQLGTLIRYPSPENTENSLAWSLMWENEKDGEHIEYRLLTNDWTITNDDIQRMTRSTGFRLSKIAEMLNSVDQTPAHTEVSYEWLTNIYPEVPFEMFLPSWLPEDWHMDDTILINGKAPHVALFWHKDKAELTNDRIPWLSMAIWSSDLDSVFAISPGNVQEVKMGDQTAALWIVEGVPCSSDNPQHIYTLAWQHNELTYALSWCETYLSLDEITRIAESIPDAGIEFDPYLVHKEVRWAILVDQ